MKHEDEFELEPQDRVWSDAFREAIHAESQRPAVFWSTQRAAIRGRISSRGRRSSAWMAFASAAALLLFALLLLSSSKAPTPDVVASNHTVTDQQLMADVEQTINNPLPDSLAPLDMLAQDMDKEFQANKRLAKK